MNFIQSVRVYHQRLFHAFLTKYFSISLIILKIHEKTLYATISDILLTICEKVGPNTVMSLMMSIMSTSKKAVQQKAVLQWLLQVVLDFGACHINVKDLINYLQTPQVKVFSFIIIFVGSSEY